MTRKSNDVTTIGELIEDAGGEIKTGPFGTKLKASEYSLHGVPVISVGEIQPGRIVIHTKTPRVDESVTSRMPEYLLQTGDVVFARKGSVERSAVVAVEQDGWFLGSDGIRLRLPSSCNPRFIGYQIASRGIQAWLVQHATGSTMASLNQGIIARIPCWVPNRQLQDRIADILGTLDDKIELNRRMNETLEAMARRLFKSWFVDFDPVRAKAALRRQHPKWTNDRLSRKALPNLDPKIAALFPDELVDSELGEIPKGWRVGNMGEVVEILDSKRVPLSGREREKRKGRYPYYGAASVMDYVDEYLFEGIHLLMGEDGSVVQRDETPVLQYVWGQFWVNNHAHVLLGINGFSTEHLYLSLKNTNVAAYVTGAVQPKLNQGNMKRISIMMSSEQLQTAFHMIIAPCFESLRRNAEESRLLEITRDKLLPKLLSGDIQVLEEACAK